MVAHTPRCHYTHHLQLPRCHHTRLLPQAKLVANACAAIAAIYYLSSAGDATHTSQSDAPLYLLLGISSYVQGKSFIAHICVSPRFPRRAARS